MSELQDFQKLVISNAAHVKGLSVGDKAPDFSLPNAVGKNVSLTEMLKSGIVIIKFYRGEWCPICNLDLREVQKNLAEIKSYGASFLAISPQSPDNALTAKEKNSLDYEVLSDADQKVIKAYKLQFDPGDDYHGRRDLTLLNGDGSKTLPVPATFIINTDQTIEAAHVEANYTERMGVAEILGALKVLTEQA
ncbi:peroxiredoxin-like family protein [Zobellia galactanivorans]|uniref:thioredoxin-dependent peroxiredoxin n=1 Tax=Zobellia galactanivorans (strain DSM 12802 / CCUG 47099 / CIP 106680 / NCIMB 13871 / Dsij) TaxID=63186 RepID=G0L954_ZOBGA|nr:peroxiredoxin-like family protein [Zobellia galactanivorans]MDO6809897.1 peroxiredoxin-like family protein [Zobellia galactanivorans]CAZ94343.1 Peroxiredoxin [Zobellia galactanivorans]